MARRVREDVKAAVHTAAALVVACALAAPGEFSDKWETLEGCRLVESKWNDGDSFHVRHGGKEYIFRLYYVDAPEVNDVTDRKTRTTQQAKYWGIKKKALYELADVATQFSVAQLSSGPFTVRTRWEDARGASQLPRSFAIVEPTSGDLAELLVANGLARIYGHQLDHPRDGRWKTYEKTLRRLEDTARSKKLGAWAASSGSPISRPAKSVEKEAETRGVGGLPAF